MGDVKYSNYLIVHGSNGINNIYATMRQMYNINPNIVMDIELQFSDNI